MADRFAVLFELEDTVVDIITIVHRNVTIDGFRTPYFRWHIDDKSTGSRASRER